MHRRSLDRSKQNKDKGSSNMNEHILTIIDMKGELRELNLDHFHKSQITLGRDASRCDIVIPDPIVSKIHGTFSMEGGQIRYQDQDSRNGTFLGIGSGRRLLAKNDGFVEVYDKSILCIGNMNQAENMVLLLYSSSSERELWKRETLERPTTTIGRDTANHICLPGPGVSKLHCRIYRRQDGYVLEDAHSTNGVLLNGSYLTKEARLKDKDVIQILGFQLLFCRGCIYYKSAAKGISLQVQQVTKIVGKGRQKKRILNHVSCEIQGNEFVAIIGGSGAGKTTLMNAISGFEPGFEGKVYCNGTDLVQNFQALKSVIGFVPQQDIIYENLTLQKMLYYSAKIRMPKDTRPSEIQKRIERGPGYGRSEGAPGIRLSENCPEGRKNVPASQWSFWRILSCSSWMNRPPGLDPGTEKNLMISLKKLAREQNKTIIMVTHTTANLHLCDKIIFMGPGGRLCFLWKRGGGKTVLSDGRPGQYLQYDCGSIRKSCERRLSELPEKEQRAEPPCVPGQERLGHSPGNGSGPHGSSACCCRDIGS